MSRPGSGAARMGDDEREKLFESYIESHSSPSNSNSNNNNKYSSSNASEEQSPAKEITRADARKRNRTARRKAFRSGVDDIAGYRARSEKALRYSQDALKDSDLKPGSVALNPAAGQTPEQMAAAIVGEMQRREQGFAQRDQELADAMAQVQEVVDAGGPGAKAAKLTANTTVPLIQSAPAMATDMLLTAAVPVGAIGKTATVTLPKMLGTALKGEGRAAAKQALEWAGKLTKNAITNPTTASRLDTYYEQAYREALNNGASEEEARTAALRTAIPSAAIESMGGPDAVARSIRAGETFGGQLAKAALRSAREEGMEEVAQGAVGRWAEQSTYTPDAAILDPSQMWQEFRVGAIGGGLMGGAGRIAQGAISARQEQLTQQEIDDFVNRWADADARYQINRVQGNTMLNDEDAQYAAAVRADAARLKPNVANRAGAALRARTAAKIDEYQRIVEEEQAAALRDQAKRQGELKQQSGQWAQTLAEAWDEGRTDGWEPDTEQAAKWLQGVGYTEADAQQIANDALTKYQGILAQEQAAETKAQRRREAQAAKERKQNRSGFVDSVAESFYQADPGMESELTVSGLMRDNARRLEEEGYSREEAEAITQEAYNKYAKYASRKPSAARVTELTDWLDSVTENQTVALPREQLQEMALSSGYSYAEFKPAYEAYAVRVNDRAKAPQLEYAIGKYRDMVGWANGRDKANQLEVYYMTMAGRGMKRSDIDAAVRLAGGVPLQESARRTVAQPETTLDEDIDAVIRDINSEERQDATLSPRPEVRQTEVQREVTPSPRPRAKQTEAGAVMVEDLQKNVGAATAQKGLAYIKKVLQKNPELSSTIEDYLVNLNEDKRQELYAAWAGMTDEGALEFIDFEEVLDPVREHNFAPNGQQAESTMQQGDRAEITQEAQPLPEPEAVSDEELDAALGEPQTTAENEQTPPVQEQPPADDLNALAEYYTVAMERAEDPAAARREFTQDALSMGYSRTEIQTVISAAKKKEEGPAVSNSNTAGEPISAPSRPLDEQASTVTSPRYGAEQTEFRPDDRPRTRVRNAASGYDPNDAYQGSFAKGGAVDQDIAAEAAAENRTYQQESMDETTAKSAQRINRQEERQAGSSVDALMKKSTWNPNDLETSITLIRTLSETDIQGNERQQMVELYGKTMREATKMGRAINFLKSLDRQVPGALSYMMETEANQALAKMGNKYEGLTITDLLSDTQKHVVEDLLPQIAEEGFIPAAVKTEINEIDPKTGEWLEKIEPYLMDGQIPADIVAKGAMANIINEAMPGTPKEKLRALQTVSMLSNVKTQVRNIGGNATDLVAQIVSRPAAKVFDKVLHNMTGQNTFGSLGAAKDGWFFGAKDGWDKAVLDYKFNINTVGSKVTAERGNRLLDTPYKRPLNENTDSELLDKVNKGLNTMNNLVQFGMSLGDAPFLMGMYHAAAEDVRTGNGADVLTPEMETMAWDAALDHTLRRDGAVTNACIKARDALGIFGLANTPYIQAPANAIIHAIETSPLGFVECLIDMYVGPNSLKAKVARGEDILSLQRHIATCFGRGALGTACIGLGVLLRMRGYASGDKDDKTEKEQAFDQAKGIMYNSFKLGQTWTDFSSLQGPFAALAAGAAAYDEKEQESLDVLNGLQTLASASLNIGNTVFQMPVLQGLSDLFGGKYSKGEIGVALATLATDTAEEIIPFRTLTRQVATAVDPYARDTSVKDAENDTEKVFRRFGNEVKAGIPGQRETLPVKYDVLGRELENNGGETDAERWFNALLNPFNTSRDRTDEVTDEIEQLYNGLLEEDPEKARNLLPRKAGTEYNGMKLTAAEQQQYQKIEGDTYRQITESLFNSPLYEELEPEQVVSIIGSIQDYASDLATGTLSAKNGQEYEPDKWIGKLDAVVASGVDIGDAFIYRRILNDLGNEQGGRDMAIDYIGGLDGLTKEQKHALDKSFISEYKSVYDTSPERDYTNDDTLALSRTSDSGIAKYHSWFENRSSWYINGRPMSGTQFSELYDAYNSGNNKATRNAALTAVLESYGYSYDAAATYADSFRKQYARQLK